MWPSPEKRVSGKSFPGTYSRTFGNTIIRGDRITSRRDRSHILGKGTERILSFNATVPRSLVNCDYFAELGIG
jgi:hypothetical protein